MPHKFTAALLRLLPVGALLLAVPLGARVQSAVERGKAAPDIQVIDEAGNRGTIGSLVATMGAGPVLILPVYTQCTISCPIQTQKLKQGLAELTGRPVRVIVFSFDPQETSESVAQFRKLHGLPLEWKVVRASEAPTSGFFEFFHYAVMTESGQFVHPDRIFVLNGSLQWQASIEGLNWNPDELRQVVEEVSAAGPNLWLRNHVDAIAWIGFANIAGSIGLLFAFLAYSRRSNPPAAK
jgi:cytochrome oxidase Cu insertion factor (SCO1/SenC/PrrC family)